MFLNIVWPITFVIPRNILLHLLLYEILNEKTPHLNDNEASSNKVGL